MTAHLAPNQIDTIFRMITDGFTDSQVVRKVNVLAQTSQADDDDTPWPVVNRQQIATLRKRFDSEGHDQSGGELVNGTIITKRDALVRRYANQMGEIEMQMDAMAGEMHELEKAGALMGASLRMTQDERGGVIEGSILSVDGEPVSSQIIVRAKGAAAQKTPIPEVLHPDLDPLFQRYIQLGHLYVKLTQSWQRIVQDLARICGYGFPPNLASPPPIGSVSNNNTRSALQELLNL